jgi:hypothetical protein
MVTTKIKTTKGNHDVNVVGEEDLGIEPVELICNYCHCNTIVQLKDRTGNNTEWFCKRCSAVYASPNEIRQKHKISTEDYDQEPAITTTIMEPVSPFDRKKVPIRGGMAELQKRGVKVTSYQTTERE